MKKFLLSLTLLFGLNHSINSSYSTFFYNFAQKNAKSIQSSLTAGNLMLYGVLPAVAYKLGNVGMEKELEAVTLRLNESDQKNDTLNLAINKLVSALGKKEDSFLDNLGTVGVVLSALFAGYRYLQYGLNELQAFHQVVGAFNYVTHAVKDKASSDQAVEELYEQSQLSSNQKVEKMTPAQRSEFLRKHGFKG